MDVVVVELPTKAKTINKYLGSGYRVLSSYGHVRDLPEKDGSVLPEEDFRIIYEPLAEKRQRIKAIAEALHGARHLYLATDPDREGEAISWHLLAALKDQGAINGVDVKRVVFHEITKRAVLEAMQHPRDLDVGLIDAYQARRALDYLVGFTLSPVLWRKLQGSRSAGRVQSVALRLICERESRDRGVPAARVLEPRDAVHDAARCRLHRAPDPALRQEARKVRPRQRGGRAPRGRRGRGARRFPSTASRSARCSAIRRRRSRPRPCSRKRRASSASAPIAPCAPRSACSRASRSEGETVGLITYMRTDSVQMSRRGAGRLPAADRGHVWRALPARASRAPIGPGPRTPRRRTRRSARPISRARRMSWGAGSTTTSAASTS